MTMAYRRQFQIAGDDFEHCMTGSPLTPLPLYEWRSTSICLPLLVSTVVATREIGVGKKYRLALSRSRVRMLQCRLAKGGD